MNIVKNSFKIWKRLSVKDVKDDVHIIQRCRLVADIPDTWQQEYLFKVNT